MAVAATALTRTGAPRAAGVYVRISDDREGRGLGVARQEEDCRKLARKLGWVVAEIYVDNDISAYSGKPRPAYRQLLRDIEGGVRDGLLVWHPDRLHRSPRELEEFITILERSGVDVATVTAGLYDLSTPTGRLQARVAGAVAKHESEHKSERLKRKHEELAKAGKVSGGGDRGFGYDDDRTTIRASEAKLIRDGARRILAGESVRSVVRLWNASGLKTSNGRSWYSSAVTKILNGARIAGLREYQGELYKAEWPAIVSRADHERLRAIFTDPARRTNRIARKYLLAGFLRCGACDQKLVARPRAAVCVRELQMREQLASFRDELGLIRREVRGLARKITIAAGRERRDLLKTRDALHRRQTAVREKRVALYARLEKDGDHVPLSQKEAIRRGRERACLTCGSELVSIPTYVCASGPGFGGCGKVRRMAKPVEDLVGQMVVAAVDGPDLQKAIRDIERQASKAAPGQGDVAALERKLEQLAVDQAKGRISRREWLAARDVIQADLEVMQVSVRHDQRTSALAPYLGTTGALAKRWPELSVDERRAIIGVVVDRVTVRPARDGLNKFDPSLIEVSWRL